METHDELMTPGCPQCAVKHLSAAIAYASRYRGGVSVRFDTPEVYAARAVINAVEAENGYPSHRDLAVGLLVQAEDSAVVNDGPTARYREARLKYMDDGRARDLAVAVVEGFAETAWFDLALAHVAEACRELPDVKRFGHPATAEEFVGLAAKIVADVKREYFDVPGKGDAECS